MEYTVLKVIDILYKKSLLLLLILLIITIISCFSHFISSPFTIEVVDENGSPILSKLIFMIDISGQRSYIYSKNGYLYIDEKFLNGFLIGPFPSQKPIYLPLFIRIDKSLSKIVLHRGGVVKIIGSPFLLNESTTPSNIIYRLFYSNRSIKNVLREYDINTLILFNKSIVIPSNTLCIISLSFKIGGKNYVYNFTKYLNWNHIDIIDLYKEFYNENYNYVSNFYNKVREEIYEAEEFGFYLGFEENEIRIAEKYIYLSINSCDSLLSLTYLRKAQLTLYNCEKRIEKLYTESSIHVFILSFIISLSIIFVVSMFFEEKNKQTLWFIIISAVIFIVLENIYPSFKIIPLIYRFSPIFSTLIIIMLLILSEDFPDTVSSSGVALIASISVSIKLALRNLMKRKVRSFLLILSIIILTIGIFSLTSFNISIWIQTISKPYITSFSNIMIVRKLSESISTPYLPLAIDEIEWIAMNNITDISIRFMNMPRLYPYTIIGNNVSYDLQGLMAFTDSEHRYVDFKEIFIKKYGGHFIKQSDENSIMLSEEVVKYMNLSIGDYIYIYIGKRKYKLKLIGIFNGDKLAKLRDPFGETVVPLKLERQDREIISVPADAKLVGIVSLDTVLKLGLKPYILTARVKGDTIEIGEAITMLLNLYVVTYNENVLREYFPGSIVSLKGSELLIPLAIVFLNIFLTMLDNVRSRKKEMEIMLSIGVNPTQIELIFISEAIIVGLISSGIAYLFTAIMFSTKIFWRFLPQIDVKISSMDVLTCIAVSILLCIISSIIPSFKSSTIITPSLQRRWKMERRAPEEGFVERLPVRIPKEKINSFLDFLEDRLKTYNLGVSICEVDILEKDYRKPRLIFMYKSTATLSRRACNTYNEVTFKLEEDFYKAYVKSIPKIYVKVSGALCSYETITILRKISIEWGAYTSKVLAALGKDIEPLYYLIEKYQPSKITILTLKSMRYNLNILKERLFSNRIPIPAFEIVPIDDLINNLDSFVEKMESVAEDTGIIFTTTDLNPLPMFLTILGIKLNKTVVYSIKHNGHYEFKEANIPKVL